MTVLKHTVLNNVHRALGAKMVDFSGWEMPVQYQGIIKEHQGVRAGAGLFDVSHMGELLVQGEGAQNFLQHLVTNDVSKLTVGKVMYTPMLNQAGGIVDDLLIYNLGLQRYLLVVNAANRDKDFAWLSSHVNADVSVTDISDDFALLAIQGPASQKILQTVTSVNLDTIKYYHFKMGAVAEVACIISRTGYTGEDGFEMYCHPEEAEKLWQSLFEVGQTHGLLPVGLGARDTLRFEAGLPLYGQELTEDINPLMAGLGWTVKLNNKEFIGKEALLEVIKQGPSYLLVGLEMVDRGIPRQGYAIEKDSEQVGWVTSGGYAPSVDKNLALAYVKLENAQYDTQLDVIIRAKGVKAKVVPRPFYRRK